MKSKSEKLYTVFNEDLIDLLKSINKWEALEKGELFCKICFTPITLKNLQIILPKENGEFEFICNDTKCIAFFTKKEE